MLGSSLITRNSSQCFMKNASDFMICSRARHENSTLDEQADFTEILAQIKLLDGSVSKVFPRTLKQLFSYDGQSMDLAHFCDPTDGTSEQRLLQLFDDYGLQKLSTHVENLNRFLAFIGESIPVSNVIRE